MNAALLAEGASTGRTTPDRRHQPQTHATARRTHDTAHRRAERPVCRPTGHRGAKYPKRRNTAKWGNVRSGTQRRHKAAQQRTRKHRSARHNKTAQRKKRQSRMTPPPFENMLPFGMKYKMFRLLRSLVPGCVFRTGLCLPDGNLGAVDAEEALVFHKLLILLRLLIGRIEIYILRLV